MLKLFLRKFVLSMIAGWSLLLVACGASGVAGTYQNDNGFAVLELRSGGEAVFTVTGEKAPCSSYTVDGDQVTLKCEDGDVAFTQNDDGSLDRPARKLFRSFAKNRITTELQ